MLDAIRFLTVLPRTRRGRTGAPGPGSLVAFPLVGLLVGAFWWAAAAGAHWLWGSAAVAAALVLVVDALLTGGLHLDALADVTDGAASRRPREEAIAIMRQPAVGALGAAALVLVVLLRWAWLAALVPASPMLIAAPVAGRLAMVVLMWRAPPADDGSLAAAFGRPSPTQVVAASIAAVACAAIAGFVPPGGGPVAGLAALAAAVGLSLGYARWWRRRFGGLVGDGVGACGLVAETAALAVLALFMG